MWIIVPTGPNLIIVLFTYFSIIFVFSRNNLEKENITNIKLISVCSIATPSMNNFTGSVQQFKQNVSRKFQIPNKLFDNFHFSGAFG